MPKAKKEKILKSKTLFKGRETNLRCDTVQLASGKPFEQDIVERPNEVLVIPQISENEIILVKQFRRGAREILLELPGGKIRGGESALDAANRELEEETKYKAKELKRLTEAFCAPSWSTLKHVFFLAQGLTPVSQPRTLDPDENIEIIKLPFKEALAKVESGEIKDAKTILGLLLAKWMF